MKTPKVLKRIVIILLAFGVFLCLFYKIFFWADSLQEQKSVKKHEQIARLTPQQMSKLKDGDIILRRGYGFFSDVIAGHLNDSVFDVTHSGILYKDKGEWFVIHSLSSDVSPIDGMQKQSLKTFLKHSYPNKILVVSPKNITPEQRKLVVERAKYYLNLKIPFDHSGVIDEPSEMYCTELLWQILDTDLHIIDLPKDPTERKKLFYSMKGMYDKKYFDIIINTYPKD